jgi:hypothetical protein
MHEQPCLRDRASLAVVSHVWHGTLSRAGVLALECSGQPGLGGGCLRYRLRRLHSSGSRRDFERGGELVHGEPVVVCAGARRWTRREVPVVSGGVRQGVTVGRGLAVGGAARARGDTGHDPVDEQPAGRVRIIDYQCEFGCARRRGPRQRWRDVVPLARLSHRDRGAVGERGTGDRDRVRCGCRGRRAGVRRCRRRWRRRTVSIAAAGTAAGEDHEDGQPCDGRRNPPRCARHCRRHKDSVARILM